MWRSQDFCRQDFFEKDPVTCARDLIGTIFRWGDCAGRVVETEAYSSEGDEACHVFTRPSIRKFANENSPGTRYIYLNYGMYWLANVLVRDENSEGFVLIRALEPVHGIGEMRSRRGLKKKDTDLCSGPGKLTIALGIIGTDNGGSYTSDPKYGFYKRTEHVEIEEDIRVGISKATDLPWRFLLKGNPHVSVKKGKVKVPIKKVRKRSKSAKS